MIKMNSLKLSKRNKIGISRNIDRSKLDDFISNLDFKLTEDQLKSVNDIYNDLSSSNRMNRLLQGDVGSGKQLFLL